MSTWQASFVFMSAYTLLTMVAVALCYKETSTTHDKSNASFAHIRQSLIELLSNRHFLGYGFCALFSYAVFFSWITAAIVLLVEKVGLSPVAFGWVMFFGGSMAMSLAGVVNGKLITHGMG